MIRSQQWFKIYLLAGALLIAPQVLADPAVPTAMPAGKIIGAKKSEFPDWFKQSFLEITEDTAEAGIQGKHLILYFHLDDCPYCHKMLEENFKHAPHTRFLQDNFDVIVINIKGDREVVLSETVSLTEKAFAQQLKIRYTPNLLFLDGDARPVLRLNGYRSVTRFKHALDFVQQQAYRHTSLARFIEQRVAEPVYRLRDHPNFTDISDLSQVRDRPLAVIFEDHSCDECDALHDGILGLSETKALLANFTVVRLDGHSEQAIIAVDGAATTPKEFAATLGISYRPGIVLFDRGREILRIDAMQRTFHLQELLRYVGERHYLRYPELRDYMELRTQAILGSGQDIDIWK